MKIASFDVETANYQDQSICSAAVATFEDGKLIESLYWLVRPPKPHGWFRKDFTENCHGLHWYDVKDAPDFSAIAPQLLDRLCSADIVVAHNAVFDRRKLEATLNHFGIPCPELPWRCTLQLSRQTWPDLPSHTLDSVANHIEHVFQHHNAKADAEAAGWVMLRILELH